MKGSEWQFLNVDNVFWSNLLSLVSLDALLLPFIPLLSSANLPFTFMTFLCMIPWLYHQSCLQSTEGFLTGSWTPTSNYIPLKKMSFPFLPTNQPLSAYKSSVVVGVVFYKRIREEGKGCVWWRSGMVWGKGCLCEPCWGIPSPLPEVTAMRMV